MVPEIKGQERSGRNHERGESGARVASLENLAQAPHAGGQENHERERMEEKDVEAEPDLKPRGQQTQPDEPAAPCPAPLLQQVKRQEREKQEDHVRIIDVAQDEPQAGEGGAADPGGPLVDKEAREQIKPEAVQSEQDRDENVVRP